MAKIDLTNSEWCDIVFADRNKAYGAYDLRKKSAKRHNISVFIVILIAIVGFAAIGLVKMIEANQEKDTMDDVTELSQLNKPKEEAEIKQEVQKVHKEEEPPQAIKSTVKFTAPVIKKDSEVSEDSELKSQDELNKSTATFSIADVKGNDDANGKDIRELKEIVTSAPVEEKHENKVFDVVEQMPSFPGGQEALLKYLSTHTQYPPIAQENGIQGRVIIAFVVERDGSVSDVHVAKSVDPALDKEAVRVVKSCPKWIPGKQNGSPVRVKYTVPVSFRLQ